MVNVNVSIKIKGHECSPSNKLEKTNKTFTYEKFTSRKLGYLINWYISQRIYHFQTLFSLTFRIA